MGQDAAFDFVQLLARELSAGAVDLPGFPSVFVQVCHALDDPQAIPERTARLVSAEPALAGRLLTMANSAAFTHTGKPISDVRSAVTRLGHNTVRSAASAFAVSQVKHQAALKAVQSRLDDLWARSTHVAPIAYVIALTCKINPGEALLTGLMHGIGSLYLIVRTAERTDLFPADGAIEKLAEDWNTTIAKLILENWDFPEQIINAVADQDDLDRSHHGNADLSDVLICAKRLALCGEDLLEVQANISKTSAFLHAGLSQDRCAAVLKHAESQIAAMREVLRT